MHDDILKQQKEYYGTYFKIKNNPRYKKIWKFIKNNNLKGKLLDVGCSNGDFSETLIKDGLDCYGLEYMDEAIKESEEKGIKVARGSFLEKFPFEDGFFDIVFAGEVIEHTINDDKFLLEINRVLKPEGTLILTTPNLVSLGNRIIMTFGKMPRFSYSEFHYKIYNRDILVKKIENSGFRVEVFKSNYILISTFFNKPLGLIGEFFGSLIPSFGENFIVYAKKTKQDYENKENA